MPPRKSPAPQPEPEAPATGTTGTATPTPAGAGLVEAPAPDNSGALDITATAVDDGLTGDGGARELEVSVAQERFDSMADYFSLGDDAASVVKEGTAWVVELFKHRPKAWTQLSQIEQRDLVSGIEKNVHELVRQVVEAVARETNDPVRCLLEGFTDKGDNIGVSLKVKAFSAEETERAVIGLHRARGKIVLLTVASADDFHIQPADDHSQPDQNALGFESGSDTVEDEEEVDLEAAAIPEGDKPALPEDTTEVVHTGDSLILAKHGICSARVNVVNGMLEALPAGLEWGTGIVDVREASPAELAAERERMADFGESVEVVETAEA